MPKFRLNSFLSSYDFKSRVYFVEVKGWFGWREVDGTRHHDPDAAMAIAREIYAEPPPPVYFDLAPTSPTTTQKGE